MSASTVSRLCQDSFSCHHQCFNGFLCHDIRRRILRVIHRSCRCSSSCSSFLELTSTFQGLYCFGACTTLRFDVCR